MGGKFSKERQQTDIPVYGPELPSRRELREIELAEDKEELELLHPKLQTFADPHDAVVYYTKREAKVAALVAQYEQILATPLESRQTVGLTMDSYCLAGMDNEYHALEDSDNAARNAHEKAQGRIGIARAALASYRDSLAAATKECEAGVSDE